MVGQVLEKGCVYPRVCGRNPIVQSNPIPFVHVDVNLPRDFSFVDMVFPKGFYAKNPVSDQVNHLSERSDSMKENIPVIANSFPTKAMADRVASCSVAELSRTGSLCSAALAWSQPRLGSLGRSARCFPRFPEQKKSS